MAELSDLKDGDAVPEDGPGKVKLEVYRRGEDARLYDGRVLADGRLGVGELLRSTCRLSLSSTEDRTGEGGGYASSTGFRGTRCLLGDPDGLSGRSCGG